MRRYCMPLALLVFVVGNLYAKQQKWVVLPGGQADLVTRLCSRSAVPRVEGSWEPTATDVTAIEKRLSDVPKLQNKTTDSGPSISNPRRYYRQYVGIVVGGRKLIYINAFCEKQPPTYWRQKLVDDCDGGCNWGVLYDPTTGDFSQFGINGIA